MNFPREILTNWDKHLCAYLDRVDELYDRALEQGTRILTISSAEFDELERLSCLGYDPKDLNISPTDSLAFAWNGLLVRREAAFQGGDEQP